jgi:ABC-2 type transport system ATP-binding protein
LLPKPALLFLDEPTSGLDPQASAALREDLKGLAAKEKVTIFLTTHNLPEAENICNEVAVIAKGKLAAAGTLEELRRRTGKGTVKVEIAGKGFNENVVSHLRAQSDVADAKVTNGKLVVELERSASVAPITSLIVNLGGSVEEVHKSTLEEAFLDIMEAQQ